MKELSHVLRDNIAAWTKDLSVDDDLSPAFTIYHTGGSQADGTAVTTASVEFDTGDDMTFKVNGAGDASIGSSGVVDCSSETGTYDTLGELYDLVKATPGWAMRLEGGIRSDTIDNTTRYILVKGDTDCFRREITFYWDTSVAEWHNFVISNRRTVILDKDENDLGKVDKVEDEGGATNILDLLKVNFNIGGTTPVLTLYLYSINGRTQTETLMATQILPDGSLESYDFTKCGGFSAKAGEYLVGRIVCTAAADVDIGTLTEFRCIGRSIGGRWRA